MRKSISRRRSRRRKSRATVDRVLISSLMQVDVERADRLLARLGDLLRASLQFSTQELTSLRDELRTLKLFAQIMQERFAVRVSLAWQVDPEALVVAIRNTGSTLAAEYRDGIGLRNCRERLNVIYGDAARLKMVSDDDSVTASVILPAESS